MERKKENRKRNKRLPDEDIIIGSLNGNRNAINRLVSYYDNASRELCRSLGFGMNIRLNDYDIDDFVQNATIRLINERLGKFRK